ncbi:MAG: hypothetical protein ABI540_00960 [Spartobacteria bacterium]
MQASSVAGAAEMRRVAALDHVGDSQARVNRPNLQRSAVGLFWYMKMFRLTVMLVLAGFVGNGVVAAEPLAAAVSGNDGKDGKLVFVTGSRIPKKVKVKAIGTNTTSPVRVYTRAEIDRMGRFTTEGILAQDPSVTIIGNGSH